MAELEHVDQDQLLEIIEELFGFEIKEYCPDDEHFYFGVVVDGEIDEDQGGFECIEDVLTVSQQKELEAHLAGLGLEL